MKRSNIGFPYPVLCDDNNDYVDSFFKLSASKEPTADNGKINMQFTYDLNSGGLIDMIENGKAKVLLRAESSESSFRKTFAFDGISLDISIDMMLLAQKLTVKALIISEGDYVGFKLAEHNKDLFESLSFNLRKGDILAISNMYEMTLDMIDPLSNKPSVFSIRPDDSALDSIRVDYTEDPNKISIWLKRDMHNLYQELREEPPFRILLASYFVLPALVETLSFMKYEGASGDNEEIINKGWYQSLENRLASLHIDINDSDLSITTIANKILSDMIQESMNSLKSIKDNILSGNT